MYLSGSDASSASTPASNGSFSNEKSSPELSGDEVVVFVGCGAAAGWAGAGLGFGTLRVNFPSLITSPNRLFFLLLESNHL